MIRDKRRDSKKDIQDIQKYSNRGLLQPPVLFCTPEDDNELSPACYEKRQHERPNHKPDDPHDPQPAEESDPHNCRVDGGPLSHHDRAEQEVRDRTDNRIPDDRNQCRCPVVPHRKGVYAQEDHDQRRADDRNELEDCHNQRPEDDVPVPERPEERDRKQERNHRRRDVHNIDRVEGV